MTMTAKVYGEPVIELPHDLYIPPDAQELGAVGLMQPLKVSCLDHEGGGAVKFLQWDGKRWNVISDWIASDQSIVRPMIEESAAQYAKEKGLKPRDC